MSDERRKTATLTIARARSVAFVGLEIAEIDVQVQVSPGLPAFAIVGLPDKAVAESRERVRAALTTMGLALPPRRVTVNLAPADLAKEGSHYDLPIALRRPDGHGRAARRSRRGAPRAGRAGARWRHPGGGRRPAGGDRRGRAQDGSHLPRGQRPRGGLARGRGADPGRPLPHGAGRPRPRPAAPRAAHAPAARRGAGSSRTCAR